MSFERHHPLRDALVLLLGLYLLWAFVDAPWDDALPQPPQDPAGAPQPLAPADGAQHHNTTVRFTWSELTVSYEVQIFNDTNPSDNATDNATDLPAPQYTSRLLPAGGYYFTVHYRDLAGDRTLLATGYERLTSEGKLALEWGPLAITYDFRLVRQGQAEPVAEYAGLRGNELTEGGLVAGATYTWQVRGWHSGAPDGPHAGNWSYPRTLAVGTTNHLAYELFEQWELPFVLVGMVLLVALVAGVFLAREEPQ